ncbi:Iron import ATP-binding/permease protein IrtA [Clostridiales bacterium CHKCI006]|nr:Iron import ATP-binding/permease protein IrtA [Clostridiales bacterium CHKCI006]
MAKKSPKQQKPKTGLARCLELASNKKGLVFLSAILSSLASIASFVPYIAVYFIIVSIIQVYPDLDGLNMSEVMGYGWLALGGIIANILLYFLAIFCSHIAAFGTLYELKIKFSEHITKIPLGYHLTIGSGRFRKIMDDNIESVEGFIAHQFPDFVASVTAPVVMVILLFAIDWRFGLASLVGIILAFIVQFMGYGSGAMKENMEKYQVALEDMNNASVEYVRGMPVVKAFNQTANSFERLKHAITEYTQWVLKFSLGWQNCMPAFTTIINNIYLVLIPVGILIGSNTSDFKTFLMTFVFYLLFVPAVAGVLNKIMYVSESFMQINGNVARMDEIFNIPVLPETKNPKKSENNDIVFDKVSFSYTGKENDLAIQNVSFKAKQGEITAIVGPSGGGKSTIANLISRFWDVTTGSIKIGNVDIRDIAMNDLMKHVSFVFQDIFLFKQSIYDNIGMGNPNATKEQIIQASKAAQCHDFIMKLPNGYDTVIGTKGIHLSGGERQRIAIARAIIKDAPIIVLDEATAFSDPENEYLIQKAFEKLMQNKTVIIIAHRLSTIRNADKILVMEKGHLVECGNHDSLIQRNGRYFQMWQHYTEAIDWKINGKAVQ